MMILGLSLAIVALLLWMIWWTITRRVGWPWWFSAKNQIKKREAEEKFIKDAVQRMEVDPRAVEAIYVQCQVYAANPATIVAIISLAVAILSVFGVPKNWLLGMLGIGVVFWAANPTIDLVTSRSLLYRKTIDAYCKRIGLPSRPNHLE